MKNGMCGTKCAGGSMRMCGNKGLALLILRLVAGFIFLSAGIMKLQGMDMTITFFGMMGLPAFVAWIVAILETLAGAMVILGIFTRKAATTLAIIIAVAIVIVHAKGGMQEVLYPLSLFAMTFALATMGGGRYSLMSLCKCGGTCMGCKSDKGMCGSGTCGTSAGGSTMKCDGCARKCGGGTCSMHEGKMVCDKCDACKGTCTMHEGK